MVVDTLESGMSVGDELDLLFHALSDSTRRDIVVRVMRNGESVSNLADRYEMSFAAVQKHVAVLEKASLVSKERRGRERIVHGNVEAVRRAAKLLDAFEEIWRHRVDQIETILGDSREATAPPPGPKKG